MLLCASYKTLNIFLNTWCFCPGKSCQIQWLVPPERCSLLQLGSYAQSSFLVHPDSWKLHIHQSIWLILTFWQVFANFVCSMNQMDSPWSCHQRLKLSLSSFLWIHLDLSPSSCSPHIYKALFPVTWTFHLYIFQYLSVQISQTLFHVTARYYNQPAISKWALVVSSFHLCLRTVVKCNIAKSQALYSAQRGLKTNNAAVLKVGAIFINIPQHPATLHSMMVRSSHQLSKQISDLIRQPSNMWGKPLHFLFVRFNDFCPC